MKKKKKYKKKRNADHIDIDPDTIYSEIKNEGKP